MGCPVPSELVEPVRPKLLHVMDKVGIQPVDLEIVNADVLLIEDSVVETLEAAEKVK